MLNKTNDPAWETGKEPFMASVIELVVSPSAVCIRFHDFIICNGFTKLIVM